MKYSSFIEQTAKDYDMCPSEVQWIKSKYPDQFYDKLEEFIKE